ncbi:glycosyltransferase family 39 protein [Streptomyces roseicoloratus]|uniref:glycosyltransferase family 39 protein n=1 Tax=Streptomyces roseicoloratus TaxID=2508722 RepID=UPI00100994B2|nr:glycosyltransferase family 39 protein [Streptomyces roseicoloratus]
MSTVLRRARRCPLSAETLDRPASATTPAPARRVPRWRASLHRAAPALGLFAAARLTGMLVLALWAWHVGRSPRALLATSWDSDWYLRIAAHGYGRTLYWPDGAVQSDLAFFPLYPGLVRAVTTVLPVAYGTAGLLLSWLSAGAAAWGIYVLTERLCGRRTAVLTVLLWGLLPHSIVLSMAYTEPLMTAFAAWSLYALLTRRWLWAGTLAALAGLSRPNGIAVAAAVLVAAGLELWRRYGRGDRPLRAGRRSGAEPPVGTGLRLWAGALLAPLGWLSYLLWVGARRGDLLGGYFAVQDGWTSRFDLGRGALRFVRGMVTGPTELGYVMALLITAAGVLLFALLLGGERPPLPVLAYTAVLLLITVGGSGFFESKPRFLLPAFPLLLPLARAMTRARPGAAIVVIAGLAGLSFAYAPYVLTLARMAL